MKRTVRYISICERHIIAKPSSRFKSTLTSTPNLFKPILPKSPLKTWNLKFKPTKRNILNTLLEAPAIHIYSKPRRTFKDGGIEVCQCLHFSINSHPTSNHLSRRFQMSWVTLSDSLISQTLHYSYKKKVKGLRQPCNKPLRYIYLKKV